VAGSAWRGSTVSTGSARLTVDRFDDFFFGAATALAETKHNSTIQSCHGRRTECREIFMALKVRYAFAIRKRPT
jgi:hypothetical protein